MGNSLRTPRVGDWNDQPGNRVFCCRTRQRSRSGTCSTTKLTCRLSPKRNRAPPCRLEMLSGFLVGKLSPLQSTTRFRSKRPEHICTYSQEYSRGILETWEDRLRRRKSKKWKAKIRKVKLIAIVETTQPHCVYSATATKSKNFDELAHKPHSNKSHSLIYLSVVNVELNPTYSFAHAKTCVCILKFVVKHSHCQRYTLVLQAPDHFYGFSRLKTLEQERSHQNFEKLRTSRGLSGLGLATLRRNLCKTKAGTSVPYSWQWQR